MINKYDPSFKQSHRWVILYRHEPVQVAEVTNIANHLNNSLHDVWLIRAKIDFDSLAILHVKIRADKKLID